MVEKNVFYPYVKEAEVTSETKDSETSPVVTYRDLRTAAYPRHRCNCLFMMFDKVIAVAAKSVDITERTTSKSYRLYLRNMLNKLD